MAMQETSHLQRDKRRADSDSTVGLDCRAMGDDRRVALIKSLATNNRFYALVSPDRGINNADTVEDVPDDLMLGIAYPCLEDGLNDFAVIRTSYETLDLFPDDEEMRQELLDMINDTRGNLLRRLMELIDRIGARKAHFLGTDLERFKSYALDLAQRGSPRRNLDSMMKVNVFGSVAAEEGYNNGTEPAYCYEFCYNERLARLAQLPALDFVLALIADVMDSCLDDDNYENRYTFDKHICQKYIALMFINYAATDPIFYGTKEADYGVSGERDMDNTPLYLAIAHELRWIEAQLMSAGRTAAPPAGAVAGGPGEAAPLEEQLVDLPGTLADETKLMGAIASICASAQQLAGQDDRKTAEFARMILSDASRLVHELKRLNIVSPLAHDPGAPPTP